jgi:UDP-glucose 4-epimerase
MRNMVVTGGAGFIGSHVAQELAKRGYQVIIIDDLSTGRKENIEELIGGLLTKEVREIQFVQGSITDLPLLKKLFQGVDCVFHLAAIPSVPRSLENPLACHEVNITGTLNVLLAAKDNGVKKVIYASSSSVYGDTPTLPKTEDMLPIPQSPYAVAKLCGEYYCQVFEQVYDLPAVCLRYFNVYGPRQDPDSEYAAVIPKFIRRALSGKPPIIFGDGEQTRDFTYVKDAVKATILAAETEVTGVYNVGSGNRITINELAKLILSLIGRDLQPILQEPRPGDIRHSLADISKMKALGYNPNYSLREGLKETISCWLR